MTGNQPLFPAAVTERLAISVHEHYGSAAVGQLLGIAGQAALSRADLSAVDRLTRGGSPTETLVRLFLLGLAVDRSRASAALAPLPLTDALAAGLLEPAGDPDRVRAALDLRPYAEAGGPDWWVLSDLGSEVRPGGLRTEHVLGIGTAGTTLAQATIRRPVGRAGPGHRLRPAGPAPVPARRLGDGHRCEPASAVVRGDHRRAQRPELAVARRFAAGAGGR